MSRFQSRFGQYYAGTEEFPGNSVDPQPTSLERGSRLAVIASAVCSGIAAIVSIWKGSAPYAVWLFVAASLILIILLSYARAKARICRFFKDKREARLALNYWPKFDALLGRFGEFVASGTGNTLQSLVEHEIPLDIRSEVRMRIVDSGLWSGLWFNLASRAKRESRSLVALCYDLEEFHGLISWYGNFCMMPLFDQLPEEIRQKLSEQSKAKLNTFRERYGQFLTEYMAFARQVSELNPEFARLPRYVNYPTQL